MESGEQERNDFASDVIEVKKEKKSDLVISEEGNSLLYTLALFEEKEKK